ncbi:unnamed protein product [Chrysoparadoxa australica]
MCNVFFLLSLCFLALFVQVTGYGWCNDWGWPDLSEYLTFGPVWDAASQIGPNGKPPREIITFVNGIYHSEEDWQRITTNLRAIFGHEVRPFYNPTTGWFVGDLTQAGYNLFRRPDTNAVAVGLASHLKEAIRDAGPRGRVLHLAHSGGALLTYLAAKHHLTPGETACIDVVTFGGARSLTRKYFSGRAVNYYARNDPLLLVDRRAGALAKLAANSTSFAEVNYAKHNTTFVYVDSKSNNPLHDHSMEGPTYLSALEREAARFRKRVYGPPNPFGWDYRTSWWRYARKLAAKGTGVHHFVEQSTMLRYARKGVARLTGMHGFFSGKLNHGLEFNGEFEVGPSLVKGNSSWWEMLRRKKENVTVAATESEMGKEMQQAVPPQQSLTFFQRMSFWSSGKEGGFDDLESSEEDEIEESNIGQDEGSAPLHQRLLGRVWGSGSSNVATKQSKEGGVEEQDRRGAEGQEADAKDDARENAHELESSERPAPSAPSAPLHKRFLQRAWGVAEKAEEGSSAEGEGDLLERTGDSELEPEAVGPDGDGKEQKQEEQEAAEVVPSAVSSAFQRWKGRVGLGASDGKQSESEIVGLQEEAVREVTEVESGDGSTREEKEESISTLNDIGLGAEANAAADADLVAHLQGDGDDLDVEDGSSSEAEEGDENKQEALGEVERVEVKNNEGSKLMPPAQTKSQPPDEGE